MAPKLLTDCPENLREAIDWLVQVQHCGGVSTVSDALATLFDNVAQDAEKSLPSLPDSDRPSARDVVSKLRAFQSTLPEDSENPNKNIIHNLCASAGNLLGYRSPGTYDGSGIVYGNASRLCDAILAFLYAVFTDVRDNQPYVAGRDVLHDDVVVKLKSQLWRGRKGFCQVIPKVADGLQRYNAAVKASNEKVRRPIETVLNYVKPGGELRKGMKALQITEASTPFQDEQTVESAVSLVERCKEVAKVFSKSLTAANDAINDLNPKLKRKVENARRSFFNHVDWLSRWSKKGEKKRLDKMVQKIKTRLRSLANAVKDKIKQEVHTVVELLKERVRKIKMKLEGIAASLEKYVEELGQWMGEAKEYIKDVKKYVNEIMQQLDGENKKKIDEAAADIDSQLGKKVAELNQWIKDAENAVNVAKEKAEDVYGRLDKDNSTKIGGGLKMIEAAKGKIESVNSELETVHKDLGTWKNAAQGVLSKAAAKAVEVRDKLDPAKDKSTLGNEIDKIDTARQGIVTANQQLGEQVQLLNEWIESAERIRSAAETKAKEAYNKLNVHEKLSKNVEKIVDAKNKIDQVNKRVTDQLRNLNQWNQKAKEVLDGAVEKAQAVHDELQSAVVQKVDGIQQANASMIEANKTLTIEVQNLDKWKDAAVKVIDKADKKCDEILKRVDKNHKDNEGGKKGPKIFLEARGLQDHGKKLLTAASEAKQKVEQRVKDALDAVKAMDSDLKRDLFEVKKKITEGINKVISDLKVDKLGEKVKQDLKELRGRIEGLKKQVENDNGLIRDQLHEVDKAKTATLDGAKRKIMDAASAMDAKFKTDIQEPLNQEVEKVTTAIKDLYEKINPSSRSASETDKKKLQKLFEHIKQEVAKIKGKGGTGVNDQNSKGLEGIVSNVRVLAEQYQGNSRFENKVNGFVMEILKHNKIVQKMLEKYAKDSSLKDDYTTVDREGNSLFRKYIAERFQKHLIDEANAAGQKAADEIKKTEGSGEKIKGYITAVKEGLTTFVDKVEERLKLTDIGNLETNIEDLVGTIVSQIEGAAKNNRDLRADSTNSADFTLIAKRILMKLIVTVRKVAGEVRVLGISVFGKIIDEIKPTVDELDKNLTNAAKTGNTAQGTAKAVDDAIGKVKTEVGGLDGKFKDVKKPVDEAIQGLESVVDNYNEQAKEQVKAAAKSAIDKAAQEVGKEGESMINVSDKMPNFHNAHEKIKSGLPKGLQALLDKHIGKDVRGVQANGAQGNHKVQLSDTFKEYSGHVNYGAVRNDFNGKLPNSISQIQTGVDEALEIIEPCVNPTNIEKIQGTTFTGPFGSIESELNEIVILVNGETTYDIFESRRIGVKTLLDKIKYGLEKGKLVGTKKGLDEIRKAIEQLQTTTFTQQPQKIEEAVQAIKAQVDDLKNKLKSDKGRDVIERLGHLKSAGLGAGIDSWQPTNSGKSISGLGNIKQDIEDKNNKLPDLTKEIEDATEVLKNQIQNVLKEVGMKLSDRIIDDDVLDNLEKLRKKIGLSESDDDSLQGIHNKISELQSQAFKDNTPKILQAKDEIDAELKKLQDELQNEVSSKLTDLVNKGFGGDDKWNGHAKSFDHIKINLQSQQSELANQPGHIALGMKDITDELQSIRDVLQGTADGNPVDRGVIYNLAFMTKHIGDSENEGLNKIKSDLDSVKISQVPLITKHLNSMSTEITNAAGQLGLNLNQLENPHINVKLKGIQSGFKNLRLTDLAEAITMCDDFLHKADDIEKNTIHALLKHVDHEVGDVIKDLTKEARENYVDSVREALELFARKVNEDLEQLPNEINRDRYMGYKGFMRYLQGPLTSDLTGDEQSVAELSSAFQEVFEQIEKYVKGEIARLHDEQYKEKNPLLPPTAEPYTPKLNDVYKALTAVLTYLTDNDGGTDRLTELVERLTTALGNLVPSDFKHPSTPLLDTVARGLTKFAGEFHNAYISTYSGQRCREEHAHKYAKVLLSMIPMTYKALSKFMKKCAGEWKHLHITHFTADDRDNALGNYLAKCGYRVSSSGSGQHGELNNMFTGAGIYELLTTPIEGVDTEMMVDGAQVKNGINIVHIISFLYNTLCHYFQVCHIYVPPEPRYPCTVRDMLSWISGLQYTRVADKLPGHCKALLNRQCHDGDIPNKEDPIMAKCIGELPYTIASTCSRSAALLTAIQGNGYGFDLAAYPYSVDFSNNRARLHYPADPGALLDMLREIACRLSKVLYFLYSQCCRSTARVKGWRECSYGRQVQSHNWQCQQIGTYSSTISTTTATITSTTTTKHGCPPTSPLQSFLSDSCHGLLPHTLTAADMAVECANCTANQPGQQCLTPLGFWDLGFAASISGTGWDLAKRLGDMCRDADSCLFVLCRTLFYLCPAAPSSLADVFALYAQVLRQWDPHDRVNHRGGTYTDASGFISHLNTDGIDSLFPMWTQLHGSYENNKLISAISSLAGHDHKSHNALSSLFNDTTCRSPSNCAPFLQPLGLHGRHTYPQKHAGLCITWIMHLAWQFWELLTHLLHALDNIDCTASGCSTCPCQPGTHGGKDACHCPSLVYCAGILPTLYRCGFTYRNADLLVTDNYAIHCGDLNAQLKQVLHSDHFTELFRQIDQLMWHIRMPFLYFLIALWTLVALYILHTFLYRMDILHIRSHLLTTKASHRIDVKALLIPSRKMLSLYNASYFDDDPAELLNLI